MFYSKQVSGYSFTLKRRSKHMLQKPEWHQVRIALLSDLHDREAPIQNCYCCEHGLAVKPQHALHLEPDLLGIACADHACKLLGMASANSLA